MSRLAEYPLVPPSQPRIFDDVESADQYMAQRDKGHGTMLCSCGNKIRQCRCGHGAELPAVYVRGGCSECGRARQYAAKWTQKSDAKGTFWESEGGAVRRTAPAAEQEKPKAPRGKALEPEKKPRVAAPDAVGKALGEAAVKMSESSRNIVAMALKNALVLDSGSLHAVPRSLASAFGKVPPQDRGPIETALKAMGAQMVGERHEQVKFVARLHDADSGAFPGDEVTVAVPGWVIHDDKGEFLLAKAIVEVPKPTYGDWVVTKDGVFGKMQGSGGLGSDRVGVVGLNGVKTWASRGELRKANGEEMDHHAGAKPPHPLFTGTITDSLGREIHFVNGKRVAGAKEVEAALAAETPREAADREDEGQKADEYLYARESAIPNVGEDVLGSARHVRNAWRGLEQAEKDGTAGELITREKLFKNEPLNLLAKIKPTNAMGMLAAYLAMQKFPASPETKGARYAKDSTPEKRREAYFQAYLNIKEIAERAAEEEGDPFKVVARINDAVRHQIRKIRGQTGSDRDYMSQMMAPNRYDPVANALVGMAKRTHVPNAARGRYGKMDVGHQLQEWAARLRAKYGEPTEAMLKGPVVEHTKDILEGASFNKTFGTEATKKGDTINPADMYVKTAERKGGPVIDADTVAKAATFVTDKLGMRAVQWGNSVTDEERQHHLKFSAEAFADLTDILGLPSEMASFNGTLALAIGARGKGSAMAHYEPVQKIINLTRKNGVGSIAHEWGHFFDHMLSGGKIVKIGRTLDADYFSEQTAEKYFDRSKGTVEDRRENPVWAAYDKWRSATRDSGFRGRLSKALAERRKKGMSDKKSRYWSSTREVFARTFERYVQHKLRTADRENTYLAGWGNEGAPGSELWPTDEEVKAMAPTFDAIFDAYKKHGMKK